MDGGGATRRRFHVGRDFFGAGLAGAGLAAGTPASHSTRSVASCTGDHNMIRRFSLLSAV